MIKQFITYLISFLLVFQPMILHAQIIPDGSTNTTLDNAQNGTPIINIAEPTSAGVSKNNFTDYNVSNENVILNNSTEIGTSNLGGAMLANPNLNGRDARIILNEVTSANPSILEGYTEIFGRKADLVVANPNGITVNGAGFINTAALTLVTGSSQFDANGNLMSFNIAQNGDITINGVLLNDQANVGLDGMGTDYTYIISRVAQIYGDIYANNLSVKTGNQNFDYITKEVISTDLGETPRLAVDASVLGSMYAGTIEVVATEEGFGVKTDGTLAANTNDITINANGDIEYKDLQARNNVNVTSTQTTHIKSDASALAGNNLNITSEYVLNEGLLYAINDINLNGTAITNLAGSISTYQGDINIISDTFENLGVAACDPETETCWTEEYLVTHPSKPRNFVWWLYGETFLTSAYESNLGYLMSGNDINFTGTFFKNESGTISAGNDIIINADIVENSNNSIEGNAKEHWKKVTERGHTKKTLEDHYEWRDNFVSVYSNTPGVIAANGTITINAPTVIKNGIEVTDTEIISGLDVQTLVQEAKDSGKIPSSDISGFGSNPMFQVAAPDSKYLYETNPILINPQNLLGSDYFLERAGLEGMNVDNLEAKFLGDAFFEQEYVRQQIMKLTGKPYLYEGSMNMDAEMESLYDSSLDEATRLNLAFGEALTQEQVDSLEHDIIWYVEKEINGVKVLTPEVYLSQTRRNELNAYGLSSITGLQTNLNSTNIINDFGAILGEEVNLTVSEDYVSHSGITFGDVALNVTAGGDITIETHKNVIDEHNSFLSDLAFIGSEGDIELAAGDAINMLGAVFMADNANLTSGGDTNISTVHTEKQVYKQWTDRKTTVKRTENYEYAQGSSVLVNGNLSINAGNDVNIIGSEVSAGNDVNLHADNNVNIVADQTTNTVDELRVKENTFSTTTTKYQSASMTNIKSYVGGNNVTISSGKDTNLIGTDVEADQDLNFDVSRDLNSIAVKDSDYTYSYTKKEEVDALGSVVAIMSSNPFEIGDTMSNLSNMTKGNINAKTTYDETVLENNITAGNNITSHSRGNTTLLSTNIQSNGTLNMSSDADILVGVMNEAHSVEEYNESFGGDYLGIAVGTTIKGLAFGNDSMEKMGNDAMKAQEIKTHTENSQLAISSNIYGEGLIDLSSGENTSVIGSNISSDTGVNISTGGDFNVIAAAETYETVDTYEDLSFDNISFSNTNSSVSMHLEQKNEAETTIQRSVTHKASNIASAGDITVNATNGNIAGSNIQSEADVAINTTGDLNVTTVTDTHSTEHTYAKDSITETVTAGNAIVGAADALYQTYDQLKDVKLQETESSEVNARAVELQLLFNTARLAWALVQGTKAAESGPTLGFYANTSITVASDRESDFINETQNISSLLQGNNLNLTSEKDLAIKGSDLLATNDMNLTGDNIIIESAQDTYEDGSKSSHYSATQVVASTTTSDYVLPTFSESTSTSSTKMITQRNATALAGRALNITTTNNTTLSGANIDGEEVNITTGGDLTVESRQDIVTAHSESQSITVGNSWGFSVGESNENTAWTNSMTSVTGDKVNVYTNTLNLTGAMIAGDADTNVNADKIVAKELKDTSYSDNNSISVGAGTHNLLQEKEDNEYYIQSVDLGYVDGYHNREGITHATIGDGTITANEIEGDINRDVENAQIVTKDEKDQMDIHLSFDTNLWSQIKTIDNIPENLWALGVGIIDEVGNAYDYAEKLLSNPETKKQGEEFVKKVNDLVAEVIKEKKKIEKKKESGEITEEEAIKLEEELKKEVKEKLGVLSEKNESGGNPGAIGYDKNGGWSYGSHQIASNTGAMDEFLNLLKIEDPVSYEILKNAGGVDGAKSGKKEFKDAWKELSEDSGFNDVQKQYTDSQYNKSKDNVSDLGFNVNNYSYEVQEMIYSLSVQHGPTGSKNLISTALNGKNINELSEVEIVNLIYKERKNVKKWFSKSTPKVQQSVKNRFERERTVLIKKIQNKGK